MRRSLKFKIIIFSTKHWYNIFCAKLAKIWPNFGQKLWYFFFVLSIFFFFLLILRGFLKKSWILKKYHTKKNITPDIFFMWYSRVFLGQKSRNTAKSSFRNLGLLKKLEKSKKTVDILCIIWANFRFLKNRGNSDFASHRWEFDYFAKKWDSGPFPWKK